MERFICINTTRDDEPMELPPGFRFHPTDEELITHYLSPKARNSSFTTGVIGEADLNKVEPWDLPWKAKIGEKEWYFFCIRDRKYPTGSRTNRATDAGYWKATGKDKEIFHAKTLIGMKKTLVFYRGRAPRGEKSNWVMHEYRLEGKHSNNLPKTAKNEWVISRIFKKSGGKKVHISGLVRNGDCGVHLPSLTELSTDENRKRTTLAADQGSNSHVTCFSNQIEEKSIDEFSSCSKNIHHFPPTVPFTFSNPNSNLPPRIQNVPSTESLCCPDSVSLQDQSILQLMLAKNGQFAKQMGTNIGDISSDITTDDDVGFRPYEDDQEFPVHPLDFDCLWNY